MIVRKIRSEDIGSVTELIRRNLDEVMLKYHSVQIIDKIKSHNTVAQLANKIKWKEIFVVELNSEIVATGALANFGDNETPKYSISNFFVKPEFHSQGIGRSLFNHLIEVYKPKNLKELHVPSSRNGVRFYVKMGFIQDVEQKDLDEEITWMTMKT